MRSFYPNKGVPELDSMDAELRRRVCDEAFKMMCEEVPMERRSVSIFAGLGCACGAWLGALLSQLVPLDYRLWILVIAGLCGGYIGMFVGIKRLARRIQPFIRRFLGEHKDELFSKRLSQEPELGD